MGITVYNEGVREEGRRYTLKEYIRVYIRYTCTSRKSAVLVS